MINKKEWEEMAQKKLIGRTITGVRYMTQKERDSMVWSNSAIVIGLDDGSYLMPMTDEEGNDAGVLSTGYMEIEIIPKMKEN